MPEGDTIHRTAAALQRALGGQLVTAFETTLAQLARADDDTPVAGRRVAAVRAVGKHVLVDFSGGLVLRTHMRMRGRWHLYRPGERWRAPAAAARIVVTTDAYVAVAFDVIDAELAKPAAPGRHPVLARLGPDLLGASFEETEAVARLRAAGDRPVGQALLDQRVMAGVGNVFKSEVLFVCGVHPATPAGALPEETAADVVRAARRLLSINVSGAAAQSGRPAAWQRRTTGRLNPAERLWVYGRRGRPCLRCGTPIEAAKQGPDARVTYWCPACQPPVLP